MRKFFRKLMSVILTLALLGGIGFLLYPTLSDQFNRWQNAQIIQEQGQDTEALDQAEAEQMLKAAEAYNRRLNRSGADVGDAFSGAGGDAGEEYMSLLNLKGDGVMGIIEIPKIGVNLPIYHTVDETVLQTGVGHLEGTSLPVGGRSTHSVLAGHTGLPSGKIFDYLDELVEGDLFTITVLGRKLVYKIDQIKTVLPDRMDEVAVKTGEDYVTLVTCTPYGINTHRLLVRGTRLEGEEATALIAQDDAIRQAPQWVSILLFTLPVLLVGLFIWSIIRRIMRNR